MIKHFFFKKKENGNYKKKVKGQIKEWLSYVNEKRNQDWLIVYIDPEEYQKGRKFNLFTMYEKLKSDFNSKKDRYIQIIINCLILRKPFNFFFFLKKDVFQFD